MNIYPTRLRRHPSQKDMRKIFLSNLLRRKPDSGIEFRSSPIQVRCTLVKLKALELLTGYRQHLLLNETHSMT